MKLFLTILFLFLLGCQSYQDRFTPNTYKAIDKILHHSEEIYYPINGVKQKVKTLDFDKSNILRRETFYRNKSIHKIKYFNDTGNIEIEINYKKSSVNDGYRINYFTNGNKKEEYEFNNNKKMESIIVITAMDISKVI